MKRVQKLYREEGGEYVIAAGSTTQRHGLGLTYVEAKLINIVLFNRLALLLQVQLPSLSIEIEATGWIAEVKDILQLDAYSLWSSSTLIGSGGHWNGWDTGLRLGQVGVICEFNEVLSDHSEARVAGLRHTWRLGLAQPQFQVYYLAHHCAQAFSCLEMW